MARYPVTERLLAEVRRVMRTRGYSPRTEETYLHWIRRFLVRTGRPASAIAFLYREVLGSDVVGSVKRARGRSRVPTVLSDQEVRAVLGQLSGRKYLIAALLYGTGMRLSEALSLRVKDLDFELSRIVIRMGKGGRDRVVMLPATLAADLARQVRRVKQRLELDRA